MRIGMTAMEQNAADCKCRRELTQRGRSFPGNVAERGGLLARYPFGPDSAVDEPTVVTQSLLEATESHSVLIAFIVAFRLDVPSPHFVPPTHPRERNLKGHARGVVLHAVSPAFAPPFLKHPGLRALISGSPRRP